MADNVIKTLTIRGVDETKPAVDGLNKTAAAYDKVSGAAAANATVTDTTAKRQLSLADAVAKAERQFNSALRAQQDFEKIQRQMNAAVAQNPALQERANAVLALAAERYGQGGVASKAFAAATSGVSAQLIALSAGAGPVGTFLAALGPWGLAGAAALGALSAAFHFVAEESARMGEKAIDLRAFTLATGLTAAQFGALKQAAVEAGVASDTVGQRFERLTAGLNEARRGTGQLYEDVRTINAGLADELQQSTTTAQGINALAKAFKAAADESARLALGQAVFGGRGGGALAGILSTVADAGGIEKLATATKGWSEATDAQAERWAKLKIAIDDTEKRAHNILASIFTDEGLKASLAAAQAMERFAQAAKDAASQKEGLSFFQSFLNKMAAGGDADFGVAASANKVSDADLAKQATAVRDALAAWKQYDEGLSKVANDNIAVQSAVAAINKSLKEQQDEAATTASKWALFVSFLGSGATISERTAARLAALRSALLDHRTGLTEDAAAQVAYNRAAAATNLDARIEKESMRIGQLGELATVTELNKQKEDALQKTIIAGAQFSDKELAAIRERNKLLTESSKIENQLVFDRQQIFKTQVDQSVDALLRANGIPPASARAEAIRDYMRMTDALKEMGDAGGQALSTFLKTFAETRDVAKATEAAAKGLLTTIIDASAKRVVNIGLNAAFGDSVGMAAGASSAAGILTTAGATVAASIVAGATEAAAILGLTIPTAAATLPVAGGAAGVEVAAGGVAAGASLAAGGAAAGTAIWGPIAILAAAAAALGALSFFGGKDDGFTKAVKDWQDSLRRGFDYEQRRLNALNDGSLAAQLQIFDRDAAKQRFEELEKGGFAINQLESALAAERLKLIDDFGKQAAEKAAQAEAEINSRRLSAQDRLFAALHDSQSLEDQLALFDRQAQRDRETEVAAGGQALVDLESAQAQERFNVIKKFNDDATESTKKAAQDQLNAINGAAKNIVDYLNGLTSGPQSTLSPTAVLSNAQAAYNGNYALALGGNIDAQNKFVSLADNLEKAARAVYASGQGYQDIRNQIINQGLALPAVQSATDPVVVELRNTIAAIQATTLAVNSGNATQALDATLQNVIKAAIDAGNAQAVAALLVPKFDTLTTTTGGVLNFSQFVAGLGPQYANVATGVQVGSLLTQPQLSALGLSRDTTTGALLTNTQLQAAGLASNSTVGTLLTQTQLSALGLSTNSTVGQVRDAVGTMDSGNLLNVFRELDGNGNGILEKSEAIKAATQGAQSSAATTASATNNINQIGYANSGATTWAMKDRIGTPGDSGSLAGIMQILKDAFVAGGPSNNPGDYAVAHTPPSTNNDPVIVALRKIVYNTAIIAFNTANARPGASAAGDYGQFALGGTIPPFGLGLVSEHLNPTFLRAGPEPIHVFPGAPSNDNSALVNALMRRIDQLESRLSQVIAGSGARVAQAVVESGAHVADTVDDQTDKLAAQERQSNRQRKVA